MPKLGKKMDDLKKSSKRAFNREKFKNHCNIVTSFEAAVSTLSCYSYK